MSRPPDVEDADPTFAGQRTQLAWSRTGIAFMALGGAVIRDVPGAGVLIVALGVAVWLAGYVERRTARTKGGVALAGERRRALLFLATLTALMSVVALAIALFVPGRNLG
jgi:uncharacterized membrane protein YidH (DUF202 family)